MGPLANRWVFDLHTDLWHSRASAQTWECLALPCDKIHEGWLGTVCCTRLSSAMSFV